MREDNLGLGAKVGSGVGAGECTGLDAFKDILGRLNGKDDGELKKEREERENMRRWAALDGRWGAGAEGGVKFVRGGWLVGDKIEALILGEKERIRSLERTAENSSSEASSDEEQSASETTTDESSRPKKKRKPDEEENFAISNVGKKRKKSWKPKGTKETTPEVVAVKVKKSKSKKKRKPEPSLAEDAEVVTALEGTKLLKRKPRKDRKHDEHAEKDPSAVVEDKKSNREKKERKKSETISQDETLTEVSDSKKSKKDKKLMKRRKEIETPSSTRLLSSTELATEESTPLVTPAGTANASGISTPLVLQGRHAIRSRNIAQKRLACLDTAALNQVSRASSAASTKVAVRAPQNDANAVADIHD